MKKNELLRLRARVHHVSIYINLSLNRRLIDEDNDDDNLKRIWCIVTYPSNLQVYNYIMHIFYFGSAFLVNVISAIILIRKKVSSKCNYSSSSYL